MRKVLLFAFILLFSHLYSEKSFNFSFAPAICIGEDLEKVFDKGRILSLLQWPILPSFGLNLSTGFYLPYFHFNFEATFAIPSFSGNMKDSDYTEPNSTEKTLFSSHKTTLKKNILICPLVGIPFKVSNMLMEENHHTVIELEPELGFYFSLKKWHAKDGYTQYKSNDGKASKFWNENWPKKEYKGKGVEYTQKIFFPFIAFKSKIKIKNKVNLALSLLFSPLLQAITKDIHFDTKKIYIDSFSLPSYAFGIKIAFKKEISKKIFLYASLDFIYIYSNNGKTTILNESTKDIVETYPKGSSGIEVKESTLKFGLYFKF